MRYSLHEIDGHDVVTTTVAADRDEALEWLSEKLRLMLTFEGDPGSADYLFDEWPEGLALHGTHSKAYHSGFRPSWPAAAGGSLCDVETTIAMTAKDAATTFEAAGKAAKDFRSAGRS